ncbi:hypothetical protein D9613_001138 [Agrocybe pediades]|uniref:Uncharacterized protein n=1 Tax=Agrocybe pediades TaxID=84607 RepID=A0A8H4VT46_9AGAR|nr:hypothetical protein D9613_001138 [Agrocybe pediades]
MGVECALLNVVDAKDMHLGLFVLNKRQPLQNYYNPFLKQSPAVADGLAGLAVTATDSVIPNGGLISALHRPETNEVEVQDYESWTKSNRSATFRLGLAKVLRTNLEKGKDADAHVKGLLVKVHKMNNQLEWFKQAKKDPGVRKWFEENYKHTRKFYIVVGFSEVVGMEFKAGLGGDVKGDVRVQPPIPIDPTGMIPGPVEVRVGGTVNSHETAAGKYAKKVVFGVQYQELKFNLFSRKAIDNAKIGIDTDRWIILNEASDEDAEEEEYDEEEEEYDEEDEYEWDSDTDSDVDAEPILPNKPEEVY